MTEREPGFEIKGVFFPQPASFRLVDTVLIYEATGMKMDEFSQGLEPDDWDERSLVGLVAVAVAQKHRKWGRQRILDFLNEINWDDLAPIGEEVEDESPPVEAQEIPGLVRLPGLSETSRSEQELTSDQSNQTSSGTQQLATGHE